MAWSTATTLGERFEDARTCLTMMRPSRRRVGATKQGFIKALRQVHPTLAPAVAERLRDATAALPPDARLIRGWEAFAVDGTRMECPRTRANEAAFGVSGKRGAGPHVTLTTVWHLGLGLPWAWRDGGAQEGERGHLAAMLEALPPDALLVMDAGFVGFDLLRTIRESGRFFLLRVGANVSLLRDLGWSVRERGDTVYLWPQQRRDQPPLVLRMIVIRPRGHAAPMYLLTNVLASTRLSRKTAAELYRRRWGVEVFYRSLKQTMEKTRLRSDAPGQVRLEVAWTVLGLWVLALLNVRMLIARRRPPGGASCAATLSLLRAAMRQPRGTRLTPLTLLWQLGEAEQDGYRRRRPKAARAHPRKKRHHHLGAPKIRTATATEIARARAIQVT